jgi:hypothetical protein
MMRGRPRPYRRTRRLPAGAEYITAGATAAGVRGLRRIRSRQQARIRLMRYFVCILGSIIGVLVTALLLVTLYVLVRDASSVTNDPLRVEIHEAVERARSGRSAWVWLTDAHADCARSARFTDTKDGETRDAVLFLALNAARDIEIVMDVRDLRDCGYVGNVHYIGMLKKLDASQRSEMLSRGLTLPASGGAEWWLCTECRPGGEWPGVIIVLVLIGLSGWLTVKIYRARTK